MVNICMIVKDRPRHTNQAITSLCQNTPGLGAEWTLTIVDDGSVGGLFEDLRDRYHTAKGLPKCVVVQNETTLGVGGSKNRAVELSGETFGRGDFLYLSDNDVYFQGPRGLSVGGWLHTMLGCYGRLKHMGVKLIGGQNHPYLQPNKCLWRSPITGHVVHSYDAIAGCSWLMEWETWDKYGPLDANSLGVRQSEDWAFCQRVIADGGLVAAISPPVVIDCGKTDTFGEKVPGNELYGDVEGIWRG